MKAELISLEESRRLVELEEVIEKGLSTFMQVGSALAEILEKRLYRVTYGTFEEYCKEEWKMERRHVYRLIDAAEAAGNVSHGTQMLKPANERQARPLTQLPPVTQPKAWEKAVEAANGEQPTAKQVEAAVEEVKAEAEPEGPKRERPFCPSNGMQYARLAIENLKKIQPNDTERDKAFVAVQRFLTQTYQTK